MASVSPNQFKLFMTGKEWQSQLTHSTDGPLDRVMPEKLAQASASGSHHGAGTLQSMRTRGFDPKPGDSRPTISIEDSPSGKSTRYTQSEGHHRVASAAAIEEQTGNPVYLPTNYVDTSNAGKRSRHGSRQQTNNPTF